MRLAFRGSDSGQQSIIGAVGGEALSVAGAQSEIHSVGVNQGRHAFAGNPAGETRFHFAD